MPDRKTLLCAGFGYSARALAPRLLARGWRVIGTHRDADAAEAIEAMGVEAAAWPPNGALVGEATHLLISAAPGEAGDPTIAALGDAIRAHAPRFEWVGYLSTTGVYGDRLGDWVDEQSELRPSTRRGELRVRAEAEWSALNLPLHIFRLAGIYGPGRGPFAKVRSGKARRIVKRGQVFSRIHREDIARCLLASIERPNPGAIYNLCDDFAAPPQQVIEFAAKLLGVPPPPEEPIETAEMSDMARSFYAESKRVSNERIKRELGVALAYPSFEEGLRAVLAEEEAEAEAT